MLLLLGTQEGADEALNSFKFARQSKELLGASEYTRKYPKLSNVFRKLWAHHIRTGHNILLSQTGQR